MAYTVFPPTLKRSAFARFGRMMCGFVPSFTIGA